MRSHSMTGLPQCSYALASTLSLTTLVALGWAQPATGHDLDDPTEPATSLPQTPSTPPPATTVEEWVAQIEASLVQITGVRVERSETGLQVILKTAEGELAVPATETVGNALVAEIPNALLALPEGDEFQQANPAEGIARVSVTAVGEDRIQVAITGTDAPPEATVSAEAGNLVWTVVPGIAQVDDADDAIEIVVTGEQEGYRASNATTGTRLNIPLLETPASIGVITEELIQDRAARRGEELAPYISGVIQGGQEGASGNTPQFTIRGFDVQRQTFVNGLRDNPRFLVRDLANIERIEILKGFSSLLFGPGTPGGVVNYITERPEDTPSYDISFEAGSFDFYRGEVDLTGPLTQNQNLLYRLNLAFQESNSFVPNIEDDRIFVAPALTWLTGGGGSLTLEAEYFRLERDGTTGAKFFDGEFFFDRSFTDPRNSDINRHFRVAAYFDQPISEQWSIALSGQYFDTRRELDPSAITINFNANNELPLFVGQILDDFNQVNLRGEIRGNFEIGTSEHQLLAGAEYNRSETDFPLRFGSDFPIIDVVNPTFDFPLPTLGDPIPINNTSNDWGIYIQDFMTLGRFRFLAGLRYGQFENKDGISDEVFQDDDFVAPSVGLLYMLTDSASIYGSFSQSTEPQFGETIDGEFIEPRRATQFEIGGKVNLFDDRLSLTTALFDLTQTNIAEADPIDPNFVIPVGDVRSRGVELDIAGQITDNFRVILAYTHLFEAEIIDGEPDLEGNRFLNSPRNSLGLYGEYEFTQGALNGLSLGAGLVYVGERAGDTANSFTVPSFVRVDLGAAYQVENWTFRLTIDNLFDERFIVSASDRARLPQGAPLSVTGSVSVRF